MSGQWSDWIFLTNMGEQWFSSFKERRKYKTSAWSGLSNKLFRKSNAYHVWVRGYLGEGVLG